MWLSDYFDDADSPLVALLMALLRRVARDPSMLTLNPDEVKGSGRALSRHKGSGAICQGCPSCPGPNWHFKTEIVAALWTMCCKPLIYICPSNSLHTMLSVVVPSHISLALSCPLVRVISCLTPGKSGTVDNIAALQSTIAGD